jgi:hypothetical protein
MPRHPAAPAVLAQAVRAHRFRVRESPIRRLTWRMMGGFADLVAYLIRNGGISDAIAGSETIVATPTELPLPT